MSCSGNCGGGCGGECGTLVECFCADGLPGANGQTPNSDIYKFSTSTGGNPASGIVSVNNANVLAATSITINVTDLAGNNMTSWLAGLNFSNTTNKAFVQIFNQSTPLKFVTYTLTGYSLAGSVVTLTVTGLGGSGASPFANNDRVIFAFTISGNNGINSVIIKYNSVSATPPSITVDTAGVPTSMDSYNASGLMVNNGDVINIKATFECPDANVVANSVQCYLDVNGVLTLAAPIFGFPLQGYNLTASISRIDATHAFVNFTFQDTQNIFPPFSDTGIISGVNWASLLISNLGSTIVTNASAVYLYSLQLYVEYIAKL